MTGDTNHPFTAEQLNALSREERQTVLAVSEYLTGNTGSSIEISDAGGLVGDLHHFLYVVEATQAPAHVTLQLPPDWNIATSLAPTSDSRTFFARDAKELSDSPILVGKRPARAPSRIADAISHPPRVSERRDPMVSLQS